MTGLPDWADTVVGFDRGRWWVPIVCTGQDRGRRGHRIDVLGLIFEGDDGATHWSPGPLPDEGGVGIASTRLWIHDDTSPDEAASVRSLMGRGSMYIRCAHGCTPRIPREAWGRLVNDTRPSGVHWLDVSLYG